MMESNRRSYRRRNPPRNYYHSQSQQRFHRPQSDFRVQKLNSLKIKQSFSREKQNGFILEDIPPKLAHFKETPTISPLPPQRPFHGLVCKCLPHSSNGLINETTLQYGLRNVLKVSTMNANNYYITRRCYYLAFCINIKTSFNYCSITNKSIQQDEVIKNTIETIVSEEMGEREIQPGTEGKLYSYLIAQQKKKINSILNNMKASLSSFMIRITGYVLFKVFSQLFSSVIITEGQLKMIENASKRNLPMIFLPLHRSHIDYLLVTWILFTKQISAPLVAAGDNLRIPIFGWLLRSLGGFFIKRKLESSKDHDGNLYRAVLQTYINKCLSNGYSLEFFIEGGRTRTGKPCPPKGGLLSIIVDAYVSEKLDDALIVPISINYDKLVDGDFTREQLGQNKVPESFWRAVVAIKKVLSTSHGHARIDFSQPFSLKEFFQKENQSRISDVNGGLKTHHRSASSPSAMTDFSGSKMPLHSTMSNSSLFGSEEYRNFINSLARHIIYDAERCQAMMSTNVVSWLFCYSFREGTTLTKLSESLTMLRTDLKQRRRDTGFSGTSLDIAIHGIKMLGASLVNVEGDILGDPSSVFVAPRTTIPSIISLNYYSNTLLPLYALDAIVVTVLFTIAGGDLHNYMDVETDCLVKHSILLGKSKWLCKILENEFVLVPSCESIESQIYEVIDSLIVKGLLASDEASNAKKNRRCRNLYDDYDDSSSEGETETYYKLCSNSSYMDTFHLWTRALAPVIESYYAMACNLPCLIDQPLPQKELIDETQALITTLLEKGTLLYGECIAAENIKNAINSFHSQGFIRAFSKGSLRFICIHEDYESEEKIFPLIKQIEEFKL